MSRSRRRRLRWRGSESAGVIGFVEVIRLKVESYTPTIDSRLYSQLDLNEGK